MIGPPPWSRGTVLLPACVPTRHGSANWAPQHRTVPGGGGVQPGSVPVACRVRVASDRQVCVKVTPSHCVAGRGFHPPRQAHAGSVAFVPTAGRVRVGSVVQVWVKPTVAHAVAGAGPHAPAQVGGATVLEHVELASAPVAFRVPPSHWFVCAYETPSQIVDGSGSQCAGRSAKQAGRPQDMPSTRSPAAIAGTMSAPHSHASAAAGQPPPEASSTQWSPKAFLCSPVGAAATYRRCFVASDSKRNRHPSVISAGETPRPAAHFRYDRNSSGLPRKTGLWSYPGVI